jgi:hypothetical protein
MVAADDSATFVPDDDAQYLAFLEERQMIAGPLTRAIDALGDYGVQADIIRLRRAAAHHRESIEWQKRIEIREREVIEERQAWTLRKLTNEEKLRRARLRLNAANARPRLEQLITRDPDEGEIMWQHRQAHRPFRLRGGAASDKEIAEEAPGELNGRRVFVCCYCRWPGHASSECETPHYLCTTMRPRPGKCIVPRGHTYYRNNLPHTCPYRGEGRLHATPYTRPDRLSLPSPACTSPTFTFTPPLPASTSPERAERRRQATARMTSRPEFPRRRMTAAQEDEAEADYVPADGEGGGDE